MKVDVFQLLVQLIPEVVDPVAEAEVFESLRTLRLHLNQLP